MPFFTWLETSTIARTVSETGALTAWLSAFHAVGFTLITGSALMAGLRMIGLVFAQSAPIDVVRPCSRVLLVGIVTSIASGLLLFSPRASYTIVNPAFQLKMLLIVAAVLFHFLVLTRIAAASPSTSVRRSAGAVALALWLGLAVTAVWFVLFE